MVGYCRNHYDQAQLVQNLIAIGHENYFIWFEGWMEEAISMLVVLSFQHY